MKKYFLVFVVTIWTISVGIGFVWMTDYSTRPGIPAVVSAKLPPNIFSDSDSKLPKLILFIHPKCSCSRATLGELERIVAVTKDLVEVKIIFYKPDSEPSEWVETGFWQRAKTIPGVKISTMSEEEIEKFGVITSGQTLLYDSDGNLVFSGGITLSRALEGDNKGRQIIETYLQGGKVLDREAPIFGCSLTSAVITPK